MEDKIPTLSGASHVLTARAPAKTTGTARNDNNMAQETQMVDVLEGAHCPTFDVNLPQEKKTRWTRFVLLWLLGLVVPEFRFVW